MLPVVLAGLPQGVRATLEAILLELQSASGEGGTLKQTVVAGAAADANIAITGIAVADEIVSVVQFNIVADTGTSASGDKVDGVVDLTAEAAITSAGNIQLADTSTTGDKLLVTWLDQTP